MTEVINPTKLDDNTVKKLEEAFSIGADIPAACFYADISRQTYYNWIDSFPELKEKFDRLREKPVLKAYQGVFKGLDDPELALRYLEKKRKAEFSTRQEITGANGESLGVIKIPTRNEDTLGTTDNTDQSLA